MDGEGAVQTDGVFPGGGAFGKREPGGRGDVPDTADSDGPPQRLGGRPRGSALCSDEPGDAAHGGGQGVCAVCGAVSGEPGGGQAASKGAKGRYGGTVGSWDIAGGYYLRAAGDSGAVHGGAPAGVGLC